MSSNPSKAQGWAPPQEFEEYRLVRLIGRGAMGQVYLAHDTVLDRPVAIKFIGALELHPDARPRFLIEARAAARLQHPNVVAIHRVGEVSGRPFIVSEFVHGASLDKIPKPVPWQQALELGIGLARGLAAAHARGVLHRDIKPANAMLSDSGEVKLLDFSLAKLDLGGGASSMLGANRHALVALAPPINAAETQPPAPPSSFDPLAATMPAATENAPIARVIENTLPAILLSPSVTETGQVMGTPLYMAPEAWGGEEADRRSDVYSLGAILFELCAGCAPSRDALDQGRMHEMDRHQAQPLLEVAPALDRRLVAIVDRCLRLDRTERFGSGEDLLQALEQLAAADRGLAIPEGNPYRGLRAFESEHRALFFGRQKEIGAVVELLRGQSFVVVAGDSGVGKSSLCRAGVLPLLKEGALGNERGWSSVTLVPGKHPLRALAAALSSFVDTNEEALLGQGPEGCASMARLLRKGLGSERGLILFIDQLEELITLSAPAHAAPFGEVVASLAEYVPGVRIMATVRGDFISRVGTLPGLRDLLARGLYLLQGLSRQGAQQAIVGPAQAKGVRFESEKLVERLLAAATPAVDSIDRGGAGNLPLLQFALAELWDARDAGAGVLSERALDAIGGVDGALARHADRVVVGLVPAQRAAARQILKRLVTAEGTRSRRTAADLTGGEAARTAALEALVRGRLVVASEAEEGTLYELAHEALITAWATLHNWLSADAESRAAKQRLEEAAGEWERLGRAREALWGARQLAEAMGLEPAELGSKESTFLAQSRRAIRQRKILPRLAATVLMGVIAATYGAVRLKARRDLAEKVAVHVGEAQAALADARADNSEVETLRKLAFAAFDSQHKDVGEQKWSNALERVAEEVQAYERASQALEAALMLDSPRKDVRALFGDALLESALAAERDHRMAERDAFVRLLALYDDGGERMHHWNASGTLTIETTPGGAQVRLERYETDARGKRNPILRGTLGTTPLRQVKLDQGSYRLTFFLPGRVLVRYPIVVGRNEKLKIEVPLPKIAEVPEGFAYVPGGRFLFGTTDEALRTGFLATSPLHLRETAPFLIARNETTFAEWIAFLESMPAGEQSTYQPRSGSMGVTGFSALKKVGDRWQFSFRLTSKTYTARSGQKLEYASRKRLQVQDWLRFPVLGIASSDAEAYAAWLRATGKVRGARLCTDAEWERAARGADDREFPHGDRLRPHDANFDETYGKEPLAFGPDEVGSHPDSESPFGLNDMAGNAWEWVRLSSSNTTLLIRSGSFYQVSFVERATNRTAPEPNFRDLTLGMRVCADVASP